MANSEPGPAIVRCCACLTRAWRRKQYGNLDKGKKQAPVVASAADNELTAWSPATEPARASDVQLGDIDLSDDDSTTAGADVTGADGRAALPGAAELWPAPSEHGGEGYCDLHEGDELKDGRYVLTSKLGFGHFATVWRALDQRADVFVALKVMRRDVAYKDAAYAEAQMVRHVRDSGGGLSASAITSAAAAAAATAAATATATATATTARGAASVVKLTDVFEHAGHVVLGFELLGATLLQAMLAQVPPVPGSPTTATAGSGPSPSPSLPLATCRAVACQVGAALHLCHSRGVLHTDVKPENVLLRMPEELDVLAMSDGLLEMLDSDIDGGGSDAAYTVGGGYSSSFGGGGNAVVLSPRSAAAVQSGELSCVLIDFGNACFSDNHMSDLIQSRAYRAPEVVLGLGYGPPADVWSLGCLTFELLTGELLFDVAADARMDSTMELGAGTATDAEDEAHLVQMFELLGKPPQSLRAASASASASAQFFDFEGDLLCVTSGRRQLRSAAPLERRLIDAGLAVGAARDAAEFLSACLSYDPQRRLSAQQCTTHAWVTAAMNK